MEHVLLLLKVGLAWAIPDTPNWVKDSQGRAEFDRQLSADHQGKGRRTSAQRLALEKEKERKIAIAIFDEVTKDGLKYHLNESTDQGVKPLEATVGRPRQYTAHV